MSDKLSKSLSLTIAAAMVGGVVSLGTAPASAADVSIGYADWQLAQDIWGKSLRTAIGEFEKANPGVKVTIDPTALGQRDVKFTTAIRAGKGPDVFALDVNPVKQYITN
ncbi:MAG: extracellular solute-binding protein, partial [Rhodospirillales bacterium]|nr:extracellular solute-binding protein [Rhodospirillales bacterium]